MLSWQDSAESSPWKAGFNGYRTDDVMSRLTRNSLSSNRSWLQLTAETDSESLRNETLRNSLTKPNTTKRSEDWIPNWCYARPVCGHSLKLTQNHGYLVSLWTFSKSVRDREGKTLLTKLAGTKIKYQSIISISSKRNPPLQTTN